MATVGVALNIPVGNGVGTTGDISGINSLKTIVVSGSFRNGNVIIEAANNGGEFCQVALFQAPGAKTLTFGATDARVRVQGLSIGTVDSVDVQGEETTIAAVTLAVPPTPGVGASSDVSALGDLSTVIVASPSRFTGSIGVEISQDNVNFELATTSFTAPGGCRNFIKPSQFARVIRTGGGGAPDVSIAAPPEPGGSSGTFTDPVIVTYTATGVEGSDFMVPLGFTRSTDTYSVFPANQGMTSILGIDCPDIAGPDRTTTDFRVITTAPPTAGDELRFIIAG
ncbi:MAG: hypothetical protein R3322_00165 [Kiloniellales bacterium]|nr:hypothetical protein [Kiloniellales bacterium]